MSVTKQLGNPDLSEVSPQLLWVRFFLICLGLTASSALPPLWGGNEVHYFDLAYRTVQPEAFTAQHSAFDNSNARFLSYRMIGHLIESFGFETTKRILTPLQWFGMSAALATLALTLGLSAVALGVGLGLYVLVGPSLIGEEWIFGTVEAKVFAYIAVLFGLSMAFSDKWRSAVVLLALATYFHFLVGGFWAASIILLRIIRGDAVAASRTLLAYTVLILPILIILATERIGAVVDMTGLDRSLANIYAEYRNPHHVAPFHDFVSFVLKWATGTCVHAGLAGAFYLISRQKDTGPTGLYLWLAGLNGYILVALLIAYLDRNTHALAPLYFFRPAGLILLLSTCGLAAALIQRMDAEKVRSATPAAAILMIALIVPKAAISVGIFAFHNITLAEQSQKTHGALIDWISKNTPPGASVLLEPPAAEPSRLEEMPSGYAAVERLSGRGLIVNFKFVPTAADDTARWYRLLQARTAFFQGDCSQLDLLKADFFVIQTKEAAKAVSRCGTLVDQVGSFTIFRTQVL
ncbi:MAG: hypothetical protein AAF667_17545 [Pseudomonadota bacterium]